MKRCITLSLLLLLGCGEIGGRVLTDLTGVVSDGGADSSVSLTDMTFVPFDFTGLDLTETGCLAGPNGCYTVYAHSDHFLYHINLMSKTLESVGPFNAPLVNVNGDMVEDVITDLAVSPTDAIYAVSHTKLYTVNSATGKVTVVGNITSCGTDGVALSFSIDGQLYAGDYQGAFCRIDITKSPPTVTQIGTLGGGLALAGDIVVVGDGTMYGTAVRTSDSSTVTNNLLVKLDPMTGKATVIGSTTFPRLYGTAFALGKAFGFTHDGSGRVVTIDPKTGQGTLFNTFIDPMTGKNIIFAGAGVNPKVEPPIM